MEVKNIVILVFKNRKERSRKGLSHIKLSVYQEVKIITGLVTCEVKSTCCQFLITRPFNCHLSTTCDMGGCNKALSSAATVFNKIVRS